MPITPDDIINSAYEKAEKQRDEAYKNHNTLILIVCLMLEKGFNGKVVINEKDIADMAIDLTSGKKQRSIIKNETEKTITLEIK